MEKVKRKMRNKRDLATCDFMAEDCYLKSIFQYISPDTYGQFWCVYLCVYVGKCILKT